MNAKLKQNRIGVSIIFLVCGLINGIWFSNLPYIQNKLDISYTLLSLALLSGTIGSLISLFFAGYLIDKFGSKRIITITSVGFSLMLAFLFWAPSYILLVIVLILNGLTVGTLDVAMNTRAVEVEEGYGKSIMASFHAFFSIAGFLAAGGVKLITLFHISLAR